MEVEWIIFFIIVVGALLLISRLLQKEGSCFTVEVLGEKEGE